MSFNKLKQFKYFYNLIIFKYCYQFKSYLRKFKKFGKFPEFHIIMNI